MNKIRVGILGLRHLHPRSYMPLFHAAEMEVLAAAERDDGVLDAFIRDFGVRGYADWRELADCERLDLAVVFLPHAECPEAASACARRGFNLLVEKPMAATVEGSLLMIREAREAGVILSTPYVWRFHPVALEMKRLVASVALGSIVGCSGRCAAGRPARYTESGAGWMLEKTLSGGGPMHNLGVHWIDLFRWMLQDEVREVVARNVRASGNYDVEDNSFALLTFSRGAVLALDISYSVPGNYPHGRDLFLSLRGTRGIVSWSPSFGSLHEALLVCTDTGEFSVPGGSRIDLDMPAQEGYAGISGLKFLEDLARSIRLKSEPSITGIDGLRALEVVESIYQAAETGRAVSVKYAERP